MLGQIISSVLFMNGIAMLLSVSMLMGLSVPLLAPTNNVCVMQLPYEAESISSIVILK